jgi:cell division protease FtsH
MSKYKKIIPLVLVLVVVLGGVWYYKIHQSVNKVSIPLSDAIVLSQSESFSELVIGNKGGSSILELTVAEGVEEFATDIDDKEIKLSSGTIVSVDAGYSGVKDLVEMGFVLPEKFEQQTTRSSSQSWYSYISLGLMLLLFYYVFTMYVKNNTQKFERNESSITFSDIGGVGEAKNELREVVEFLRDKDYFKSVGAKIPRGTLLLGPPGVGKTMLAKAVASEANVPFYYTTGSEFHTMWAGLAAQKVKKLFSQVKKSSGVLFIDEFDSVAHNRTLGTSDVGREWNHTLNQLLAEMDGFDSNTRVIVLAATNRADVLDPAVTRPGRFDRRIMVALPSLKDRVEILKIHARNKPMDTDADFESISKQTAGFSGADLGLLMNEAAILAGREHKDKVNHDHLARSIDKVLAGSERKNLSLTEEQKKLIAYHEAGHALVATKLPEADKVQRISIIPRGQAGGFTRTSSENEGFVISESKALSTIQVLLGGRVAEEVALGSITSGAQADLQQANAIAHEMVEKWGMGKKFGLRFATSNPLGMKDASSEAQKAIDDDILKIFNECYQQVKNLITQNIGLLDKLAGELLKYESLNEDDVKRLLNS